MRRLKTPPSCPALLALWVLAACADADATRDEPHAAEAPASKDPSPKDPAQPDPSSPGQAPPMGGASLEHQASPGQAPALHPELVTLLRAGGPGDQHIRQVYFVEDGRMVAQGDGFTLTFDPTGRRAVVSGDLDAASSSPLQARPRLPGDPGQRYTHPGTGLSFTVGYRQAGGSLQTPIFRAWRDQERVWALWGHAADDIKARSLGADSRCYQAWAMPGGRIGVQCWTDGGNSVLTRDPRDLSQAAAWTQGAYQPSAGGMSSLYALIDPSGSGQVVSGTFVASHVHVLTVDGWGRVYLAGTVRSRSAGLGPSDRFALGLSAGPGLTVLDPDLRSVRLNIPIGGVCDQERGQQAFGAIAQRDGMIILGGSICPGQLSQRNPIQPSPGGGQDALVAIVKLW